MFGESIQTISLHSHSAASGSLFASPIGIEMFSPQVVFGVQKTVKEPLSGKISMDGIVNTLKKKVLQQQKNLVRDDPGLLISEDEKAKDLAFEHSVDIVTTANVIEVLVRTKKWNIPLLCTEKHEKGVVFIEDSLPTPSDPRECLSVGFTEALYGQVQRSNNYSGKCEGRYIYTLLTFTRRAAKVRVLVRSVDYLVDSEIRPIVLLGQVEYFSECGYEDAPAEDRAWWFMLKVLRPHCRLALCRVDARTAGVLEVEEKGVADAIIAHNPVADETGLNSLGRFECTSNVQFESRIQSMTDFFFATMTFERDDHWSMICHPPRASSDTVLCGTASVHKEINCKKKGPKSTASTDRVINFENDWEVGKAVFLNDIDFRGWAWNHERFPYTFPHK